MLVLTRQNCFCEKSQTRHNELCVFILNHTEETTLRNNKNYKMASLEVYFKQYFIVGMPTRFLVCSFYPVFFGTNTSANYQLLLISCFSLFRTVSVCDFYTL